MSHILIVDDEAGNRLLLEDMLGDDYKCDSVASGDECIEFCANTLPDIILLDVNMPGKDGYTVCRELKSSEETAVIPIVFVSARVDINDRLEGFEAGGEDYVIKPVNEDELEEKIKKGLNSREYTKKLEENSKSAMSTAFQAISSNSEMGSIVNFLKSSFTCENENELAAAFISSVEEFSLSCCLCIKTINSITFYGCDSSSLESKILENAHGGDKIVDFSSKTLVNEEHISLLVRNMPTDDLDRYGRIKDHLTVLLNGAEYRIRSLNAELALDEERASGLGTVIGDTHKELKHINSLFADHKKNISHVMERLATEVENQMFSLGLEDDQEKALIDMIEGSVDEMNELTHFVAVAEHAFDKLLSDLNSLAD